MQLCASFPVCCDPAALLRLTTPDLEKLIAIYRDENPVVTREDYVRYLDTETGEAHATPCQVFNDGVRLWGIRYTYDEEDLTRRIRGFRRHSRRREPPRAATPHCAGSSSTASRG